MTPIKWNGSSWVETTGSDPDWYDYSEKKWANAKTSDGSMWVWIPRYAYSIPSGGYHTSNATEISIEFMKGTSNEGANGRTSFNNSSGAGNWNIHPAFNYGQPVSGLWVAKFEASSVQGNSNSISGDNVTNKTIQVKPGVASWRNIYIGTAYTNCLNYNKTLNSHMMKNDEWGAIAYLSRSKYGKNSEITINGSSSFYTGGGNGNAYVTNVAQSTTGNVWGVYDMSGGSWEYVAAYVNNDNSYLIQEGLSLVNGESKTKNVYIKGSSNDRDTNYNANSGVYGDAVYEISENGNSDNGSWEGCWSYFPDLDASIFIRGGDGIFNFSSSGGPINSTSFRPVLIIL